MTVNARPVTAKITSPVPIIIAASSGRFCPIFCPTATVTPIEKLTIRLVSVSTICDPVETAETSAFVPNCPTTSRSTAPYIACKNIANSTGSMNLRSFGSIAPLVKSLLFIYL